VNCKRRANNNKRKKKGRTNKPQVIQKVRTEGENRERADGVDSVARQ
jgi:hypothetical protein